ncbi:hypothetical protein F5Y16DRAFT_402373 [Xylariaceae sp. FL0255]|nr:hypothetical protein F5Y16DRAFT_402373 [Xylariaceae sp. FL0255]
MQDELELRRYDTQYETVSSDSSSKIACLSAENHDGEIRDPLAHYFGCIEFWEREAFFEEKTPIWKKERDYQLSILQQAGNREDNANLAVQKLKDSWKSSIRSELRRIAFLRRTLSEDDYDKHLVQDVNEARKSWRRSPEYQGIHLVRTWREKKGKKNGSSALETRATLGK